MPIAPSGDAVEPLMEAVDGARWVKYDRQHRLLFVGRIVDPDGFMVYSYDVVTGAEHDAPWPVDVVGAAMLGPDVAFGMAVSERMAQGY